MFTHNFVQGDSQTPSAMPIPGTNWRAWNATLLAVDLTRDEAKAINDAGSVSSPASYLYGAYRVAQPEDSLRRANGAGTYLVPVSWIHEAGAQEAPELQRALAEQRQLMEAGVQSA